MGVTYRSAIERDAIREAGALQRFGAADAGLVMIAAVAALTIVMTAAARLQVLVVQHNFNCSRIAAGREDGTQRLSVHFGR